MKNTHKISIGIIALIFVGFLVSLFSPAFGAVSNDTASQAVNGRFKSYEFFASTTAPTTVATTTSATSTDIIPFFDTNGRYDAGYFVVAGAKKISVFFGRGGLTNPNAGSTVYKVQVSPDGVTWVDYNKLIDNVTNTNAQTLTRVASKSISAATSTLQVAIDPNDSVYAIRCIAVETTDGEHRCFATSEF